MEKKKRLKVYPSQKKLIAGIAEKYFYDTFAKTGYTWYDIDECADTVKKIMKNLCFEQFAVPCNVCGIPIESETEAIDVLMQCTRGKNAQWKQPLDVLAKIFALKSVCGEDFELYKLLRKLPVTKLVKLALNYAIAKR